MCCTSVIDSLPAGSLPPAPKMRPVSALKVSPFPRSRRLIFFTILYKFIKFVRKSYNFIRFLTISYDLLQNLTISSDFLKNLTVSSDLLQIS